MAGIVCLIVVSVTMRKVFNAPLHFSEEVVGLLMSASLFLALPMVTLRGSHVRVSIVATYLETRSRRLFHLLSCLAALVGIACCVWLTVEAIPWLEFALNLNLKTETSRVLLYPWMAALPLSIVITGVIFLFHLAQWVGRLAGWVQPDQEP